MTNIPLSPWPSFTREEVNAVRNVLLSNKVNYWTGNEGKQFEQEFADWCGTGYAVALANGTIALDAALLGLGVGKGDEVIVPPRTFIATASSVVNAGATPVFADIDPDSGNITAASISEVLTPKTRAIICVHLAGWPCDMDPIMALAEQHNLKVIEDCAQAHGATYKGRKVGSIGHAAAWSFCQDKIMTTGGEGGMVTTSNEKLWKKIWSLKDHGKSYDAVHNQQHPPGFRWLHESFGSNWRMTEMQAAIGRIQLRRMPVWRAARKTNARAIEDTCSQFPEILHTPTPPETSEHAYYKFYTYVRPEVLGPDWNRDRIMNDISAQGIPCFSGSCSEVYLEKAFENTDSRPAVSLPNAKHLGETSLMFLTHPTLTPAEIHRTCQAIETTLHKVLPHRQKLQARN